MMLIVLTILAAPATVLADGPPEGPVHLALGDSQSFGTGATLTDKLGYNAVLSRWATAHDCREGNPDACPRLKLVNLAIPGATSASLISSQLQPAVDLITNRAGDGDLGNDVVLITLTIGGNDIVGPVLAACASDPSSAGCAQVIAETFGAYASNLAVILGTLRAAAGPDTQIVISTYDNPLGSCVLAALEPFGDVVLEGGGGLPAGFNDIIRLVAGAFDVDVADIFGRLGSDDWVGGSDCTHPDNSGYHEMAEVFREVLD